jgi:hypothetical protein
LVIPNRVCSYAILAALAVSVVVAGALSPASRAQQGSSANYSGVSVEPNQQIFATMCALDAAGFAVDESALADTPARMALRAEMLKMQGPAATALRRFYRDHVRPDRNETLSRFVAFALVAGPPPDFRLQPARDQLSPDVLSLDGFQEILAAFYREANLEHRWHDVEPEYEREAELYQSLVRRIVTVSNGYLREVFKPSESRSFTVYVEPPMGSRTVFRNSGDQYAIVVGAGSEDPTDEIGHAYLHFLLDPLLLRNRPLISSKGVLLGVAARAPQLPPEYHDDFVALMDECLIKAVELRMHRLPPDQLEESLKEDDRSGYILVRPLVQQLAKFEKAEPAMSYYFPDLIAGIDVQAEQKRLQSVTFAGAETTAAMVAQGATPGTEALSETDQLLDNGDREIARQDAAAAATTFEKVLERDPHQPRALYGLAIASVLSGQGDRAQDLFEELVSERQASIEAVDPDLVAWSHVYLARIHDLAGERDLAVGEYRAALAVNGAPDAAHSAAERGVDAPYRPPSGTSTAPKR